MQSGQRRSGWELVRRGGGDSGAESRRCGGMEIGASDGAVRGRECRMLADME